MDIKGEMYSETVQNIEWVTDTKSIRSGVIVGTVYLGGK